MSATVRHVPAALGVAVVVEVALRVVGLSRVCRLLGIRLDTAGTGVAEPPDVLLDDDDVARLRAVQQVTARWPWGASGPCLRQALTAGRLLRHRAPMLRLGIARGPQRIDAHAWLVVDGASLDSATTRWQPLARPRS